MDLSKELTFAKELGKSAYEIAQKYYKKNPSTELKNEGSYSSYVTVADEEINQLVIDQVREQFPQHGVLGEEQSFGLDKDYLWVCDPIDGTLAFTMGQPTFMFSLALVTDGDPVVCVAVDLSNNNTYHAVKNHGAYLNDAPLKASKRALSESRLYLPSGVKQLIEHQNFYNKLIELVSQVNPLSGGVFKGCAIAEGMADGSAWLRSVHPWDVAAITLLIRESGGVVSDRNGNEDLNLTKELDGIIMSNSKIHSDLLSIVNETI